MMRKIISIMLIIIMSLGLFIGCNSGKKTGGVETFIKKLISVKTYENIEFNEGTEELIEKLREALGEELTENGFNMLISNRTPSFYYGVINEGKFNKISNIKITKTKEVDNNTYTHYEYEVSYKLSSDSEDIDMTDYMVFKVLEDGKIDEVYVLDDISSIYSEYKNLYQ